MAKIKFSNLFLTIVMNAIFLSNLESLSKNNEAKKYPSNRGIELEYKITKVLQDKEKTIFLEFEDLKKTLIKNNETLNIIQSQINQAKSILKSKYSLWYPRLTITSDQLPKYTTGDTRQSFLDSSSGR